MNDGVTLSFKTQSFYIATPPIFQVHFLFFCHTSLNCGK
jgi:hypothetical protein